MDPASPPGMLPPLETILRVAYVEPLRTLPLLGTRPLTSFPGADIFPSDLLEEAEASLTHAYEVLNAYDARIFSMSPSEACPPSIPSLEELLEPLERDIYAYTTIPEVRRYFLIPLALVTGGMMGVTITVHGLLPGLLLGGILSSAGLSTLTALKRDIIRRETYTNVYLPWALRRIIFTLLSSHE